MQNSAATEKAQLEVLVDGLKRQLESASEKLSVYERVTTGEQAENRANGVSEEAMLRAELADVRYDLKT